MYSNTAMISNAGDLNRNILIGFFTMITFLGLNAICVSYNSYNKLNQYEGGEEDDKRPSTVCGLIKWGLIQYVKNNAASFKYSFFL